MATLQSSRFSLNCSQIAIRSFPSPSKPSHFKKHHSRPRFRALFSKSRVLRPVSKLNNRRLTVRRSNSDDGTTSVVESDRPPFDLNLAVVLAGFAFEAYSSPPENVGWREMDAAECQAVFLSEPFLREVYDGQLFIKLKYGVNFPALDPWGTSDPYVVLQLDGQVVKSKKVKDSWRIVNHRDIIPTVPRLMGYCHMAQPVYLVAGYFKESLVNKELLGDEHQGDLIGESTPDVLGSEFMKGEKQLVEKILQTEINLLRSIRDGTALMQHMEDFYYIMLLERVRSNYRRLTLQIQVKKDQLCELDYNIHNCEDPGFHTPPINATSSSNSS